MGWRSDAAHWSKLHKTALLLAALATPLVISVHSVVGLDFAISNVPGWHHTIFPPYFVAGAVFSGLAMVLIVGVLMRKGLGLEELITADHLDKAAVLMLVTGLLVTYGYTAETFGAWYKGDVHEVLLVVERATGPYAVFYWGMIFFNCVLIQLLWFPKLRRNLTLLVVICIGVLIGMWLERYVIVSISLTYSYLPPVWELFRFNWFDLLTVFSPFGFFFAQFFLFMRFFPVLPISEVQQVAIAEGKE
jgi:molybdopterin-containing oxidoreductase family membrane subunit